jgi:hypothetical protein
MHGVHKAWVKRSSKNPVIKMDSQNFLSDPENVTLIGKSEPCLLIQMRIIFGDSSKD